MALSFYVKSVFGVFARVGDRAGACSLLSFHCVLLCLLLISAAPLVLSLVCAFVHTGFLADLEP